MIHTELPEEYLAPIHQKNLQLLRSIHTYDVISVLETVNYCLSTIPITLYDKILELDTDEVEKSFSEGHWINSEVCLMIKCWKSKEWCMKGAQLGKLDWIIYAFKNGMSIDIRVFNEALQYGHLHIAQFLQEKNNYMLNEEVFVNAVLSSKLEIMEWILKENCPFNPKVFNTAIRTQNLEILQWLKQIGCIWNHSSFMIACIHHQIKHANIGVEIIKWLHQQGCPNAIYCLGYFVKDGNTDVVNYFLNLGYPCTSNMSFEACIRPNLKMIKLLKQFNCPFENFGLSLAIARNTLEIITYLAYEFPNFYRDVLFMKAVSYGKLNVMQWCKEVNHTSFIMRPLLCIITTRLGKLDILKWLKENGCPWAKKNCYTIAKQRGHTEIAEWILNYKKGKLRKS
jgi:hypothetical protein